MEANISVKMDNAAFVEDPNPNYELGRILKELGERLMRGRTQERLYDYNGNFVGTLEITERD